MRCPKDFEKLQQIPGSVECHEQMQGCAYDQENLKIPQALASGWTWSSAQAGSEG